MPIDVTFLIQNKNYGCYLRQCLESILNQSKEFTYQIIGLDAGSTDDSREIYTEMIGGYIDVTGCNQAEALNIGLEEAKGKYLGWINSDDYYKPDYAKTHISLFRKFKHQNVILTFAERLPYIESRDLSFMLMRLRALILYEVVMDRNKRMTWVLDKIRKNNYDPIKITRKTLRLLPTTKTTVKERKPKLDVNNLRGECVHFPAAMLKTESVIQIGGWNEKLIFCIDDDIFLRSAQIGNLAYTPKFTAVCRTHGKNMSTLNMYAQELEVKAFYNHYKNAKLGNLFIEREPNQTIGEDENS